MNNNTLSVVMSNYNHGHFLPEALEAILSQSYLPLEIIIIDDASTDNSFQVLNQFAKKEPLIRLIRNQKNLGVVFNYNRLVKEASGEYIYLAAADDKVLPGFFKKSMDLLEKYPQAGLCSALSRSIDENGKDKGVFPSPVISKKKCYISPQKSLNLLQKYGSWIKGDTTIYKRNILLNTSGYDPKLESFCDGFMQQVIALEHCVCFVPEPLACFREMPYSYSASTATHKERSLAVIQHAKKLMTTTYKELFPLKYIDKVERRLLWTSKVSAWYNLRMHQEQYSSHFSEIPGYNIPWFDNLFSSYMKFSINLQLVAVMLYWGIRFKLLDNWLFYRWLKRAKTKDYPGN